MPGTAASGSRGNGSAGMNEAFENVVRKGIAGFYYVSTAQGLLETKARGIFRKRGLAPLPGDTVMLEEQEGSWVIAGVQPRKNTFVRPAVANVDVFFLVVSTCEPQPSTWVMDQLLAIAIDKGAQPVVVVTKTDLASGEELVRLYAQSGILSVAVNAATGDGLAELQQRIAGNICVFCGNSGVGKSTLLNALLPGLGQETAAISKKLGRGKHTTRQVELFEVCGGLVADTPGFSSLDLERAAAIPKENLQYAFPEMRPYLLQCRFTGCSHTCEKGCAVRQAVEEGKIAQSRYQSYQQMYQQARERKEWEN